MDGRIPGQKLPGRSLNQPHHLSYLCKTRSFTFTELLEYMRTLPLNRLGLHLQSAGQHSPTPTPPPPPSHPLLLTPPHPPPPAAPALQRSGTPIGGRLGKPPNELRTGCFKARWTGEKALISPSCRPLTWLGAGNLAFAGPEGFVTTRHSPDM